MAPWLNGNRCGRPLSLGGTARERELEFMSNARNLTTAELEAGLEEILRAPKDAGELKLIVRRPATDQRETLEQGELDIQAGLVGDKWSTGRGARPADDGSDRETQLTLMNSRVISLIAQDDARWALAGDQFFLDLDLSLDNLPARTQLAIGTAVVEVTPVPHTGCKKFVARFGPDAMKFVNSDLGRRLNLRGINAKVVQPGVAQVGDLVKKL